MNLNKLKFTKCTHNAWKMENKLINHFNSRAIENEASIEIFHRQKWFANGKFMQMILFKSKYEDTYSSHYIMMIFTQHCMHDGHKRSLANIVTSFSVEQDKTAMLFSMR